jgi:intracellular septation protein A
MKTMANSPMAQENQDFKTNIGNLRQNVRRSILIGAVLPAVIYLLASPHMSTIAALALGAIPPLLYSGYGWVRAHSLDPISIISLFMAVVGMLLALLVHDPHILMLKDSFLTGAFGLLCLLSLLSERPIVTSMYWRISEHTPEQLARLHANWQVPYVRFVRRLITVVWGVVFVGETLLDTYLVYHLPTAQWVVIHPVLYWGTVIGAFGWAFLYRRHIKPKFDASLQQIAQEQEALAGEDRQEAQKHAVG